jgi:hypothetical protein
MLRMQIRSGRQVQQKMCAMDLMLTVERTGASGSNGIVLTDEIVSVEAAAGSVSRVAKEIETGTENGNGNGRGTKTGTRTKIGAVTGTGTGTETENGRGTGTGTGTGTEAGTGTGTGNGTATAAGTGIGTGTGTGAGCESTSRQGGAKSGNTKVAGGREEKSCAIAIKEKGSVTRTTRTAQNAK